MLEENMGFECRFPFDPLPESALELFRKWRDDGRLGFVSLPGDRGLLERTLELAGSIPREIETVIVDGIGGSALGLKAILSACGAPLRGRRPVIVVDSPDAATLRRVQDSADPRTTMLVVITKSGSTAETAAVFLQLWRWFEESGVAPRVVAVTDPGSGDLRRLVEDRGWPSLPVPRQVGGRYSVLSPVGLFPAALAGLDAGGLLLGAREALEDFEARGAASLPCRMASAAFSRFASHPVHAFFTYCDSLYETGLWFAQLWAESLGKRLSLSGEEVFTGQTPLACRGPADQHSLVQLFMEGPADKYVTILTVTEEAPPLPGGFGAYPSFGWLEGRTVQELRNAEASATASALSERGLPVSRISLQGPPGEAAMGRLMMSLELATVLTGLALGVDPLDQPGVERGKQMTYREMGRAGYR